MAYRVDGQDRRPLERIELSAAGSRSVSQSDMVESALARFTIEELRALICEIEEELGIQEHRQS
jgi:hypothetical protein